MGPRKRFCHLEPLNTWEAFFDRQGKSNELLQLYNELNKEFISDKKMEYETKLKIN
jgi:hypothetical protein